MRQKNTESHVIFEGLGIDDGEILEGSLPKPKMRLVQAWIEIHRDDLLANWKMAVEGQQPFKIEPLR